MDGNEELKEKLLDHSMTREELLLEHTHTFIAEYSYKTGQLEIYPEDGHFVDFDRKSLDTDFEHAFYKTVFKRDLPISVCMLCRIFMSGFGFQCCIILMRTGKETGLCWHLPMPRKSWRLCMN